MAGGDFFGGLLGGLGSLIGGYMQDQTQEQIAQENIQNQINFAQHGIQWKVADAKAAGINPLAALGASTNSFSNVVGGQGMGKAVADAGQNLGRAAQAVMSPDDRAYVEQSRALDLQHKQLENDFLGMHIAASNARTASQPGDGPPTPNPGQIYGGGLEGQGPVAMSNGGQWLNDFIKFKPQDVSRASPGNPNVLLGMPAEQMYTAGGQNVPGRDLAHISWVSDFAKRQYEMNNTVLPTFGLNMPPGMFRNPFTGKDYYAGTDRIIPGLREFWRRYNDMGSYSDPSMFNTP